MNIVLNKDRKNEFIDLRGAYVNTLIEMAKEDDKVLSIDADLTLCTGYEFHDTFPDRHINFGIQEANMIGACAGLYDMGFKPYIHTFGWLLARRTYDMIYLSMAYAQLGGKLMGSDAGITAAFNGGTHMSLEDGALMRTIPGSTVLDIADPVQMANVMKLIKDMPGLQYVRWARVYTGKATYAEGSEFEIGKGVTLRDGSDVTIIAAGTCLGDAIDAAEMLEKDGINARVIDMFTVKPIDKELVIKAAQETGAIVTAENHTIIGGLGSAVMAVTSENCPVPVKRIGCEGRFGQVGTYEFLKKEYKLMPEDIAAKAKEAIAMKK